MEDHTVGTSGTNRFNLVEPEVIVIKEKHEWKISKNNNSNGNFLVALDEEPELEIPVSSDNGFDEDPLQLSEDEANKYPTEATDSSDEEVNNIFINKESSEEELEVKVIEFHEIKTSDETKRGDVEGLVSQNADVTPLEYLKRCSPSNSHAENYKRSYVSCNKAAYSLRHKKNILKRYSPDQELRCYRKRNNSNKKRNINQLENYSSLTNKHIFINIDSFNVNDFCEQIYKKNSKRYERSQQDVLNERERLRRSQLSEGFQTLLMCTTLPHLSQHKVAKVTILDGAIECINKLEIREEYLKKVLNLLRKKKHFLQEKLYALENELKSYQS